jgi:hypothetical protein
VADGFQRKARRELDAAGAAVRTAIANLKSEFFLNGPGVVVGEAEEKLAKAEADLSDTDAAILTTNQDIDAAILAGDGTGTIRNRLRSLGDQRDDQVRRCGVLRKALAEARDTAAADLRERAKELIAARLGPAVEAEDMARSELEECVSQLFWAWATSARTAAVWKDAAKDPERVLTVLLK